jgi:hypothetical protein
LIPVAWAAELAVPGAENAVIDRGQATFAVECEALRALGSAEALLADRELDAV